MAGTGTPPYLVGPRTRRRAAIGVFSREGLLAFVIAGLPCSAAQLVIALVSSAADPMDDVSSTLIISLAWGVAAAIVYTRWIRVRTRLKIIKALERALTKFTHLSEELGAYLEHFASIAHKSFHVLNPGKDRGYFRLQELHRALTALVGELDTRLAATADQSLFAAIDLLEQPVEVQDSFSVGEQQMKKVYPLEIPGLVNSIREDLNDVLRQRTASARSMKEMKEASARSRAEGE